ncbi:MAG: hypothetical protein ACJA1L_001639 [Paracoccaceae bacterium]|jgi:hypothetical protein
MSVYERRNAEPDGGEKVQLFVRSSGAAALGRVFDRRPGRADRHFVGDAFFPVGGLDRGRAAQRHDDRA